MLEDSASLHPPAFHPTLHRLQISVGIPVELVKHTSFNGRLIVKFDAALFQIDFRFKSSSINL